MGTPGCQVYKVGRGSDGLFLHDSEMWVKYNAFCLTVARP